MTKIKASKNRPVKNPSKSGKGVTSTFPNSSSRKDPADEVLVEQFLHSPENAGMFDELIARYRPALLRYMRSLGVEQNLAEDVVQDSFVKAYRKIRSFNPKKGKFSPWIYRIAHNSAMDQFKKSKKDLTVDDNEWWYKISVPEEMSNRLNLKMDFKSLCKHLDSMDVKYRHPLTLYYLEGKSYKDIAQILGVPTPTVSTRIKRGREKLTKTANEAKDIQKKETLKNLESLRKSVRSTVVTILPDMVVKNLKQTRNSVRNINRKSLIKTKSKKDSTKNRKE